MSDPDQLAELRHEVRHLNHQLQQLYAEVESNLDLARRVVRQPIPHRLVDIGRLRFGLHHRSRCRIGGDFFDVRRLDEHHVAVFLADCLGQGGMAAGWLTVFVRHCLVPKEISGQTYRLLEPGEVLNRINQELLALKRPEPPLTAMVYAQLNSTTGSLSISRAGPPAPIRFKTNGVVERLETSGPMLGAFKTDFPTRSAQLSLGEKLFFISDGVAIAEEDAQRRWSEAARHHGGLSVQELVDRLAFDLLQAHPTPDDFTLLGVELIP